MSQGSAQSRDTERKADLRALQSALELYKQKNGRYPAGCNAVGTWSGETGTSYACTLGNQYIVGLAPTFIPALPTDPRLNGSTSGYVYTTNSGGTVYKLMAKNTAEAESLTYTSEFKSCDVTSSNTGICDSTYPANTTPNHCQAGATEFQKTFAVWSGYATGSTPTLVERNTEDIICDVP